MKSLIVSFVAIFFAFANLFCQGTISRKVLLTLQPGEKLQTYESCIDVSFTSNQLVLVTIKDNKLYKYENGKRTGPFDPDAFKLGDCNTASKNNCSVCDLDQAGDPSQMLGMDENGMTINFKGKKYGPYKMITEIKMSAEKSWFIATVLNNGKAAYITSDGVNKPVDENIHSIKTPCSGKNYLVVLKTGEANTAEMMNMDMANITQEQLMEMIKKMEEKKKNAGPPQAFIVAADGTKYGPYSPGIISDSNPAFCKTSGTNWYLINDNALYINGKLVKEFSSSNIYLYRCDIWISPDGKRYAIFGNTKVVFSDGASYPAPIKTDYSNENGKITLRWISLENGKELVSYAREL